MAETIPVGFPTAATAGVTAGTTLTAYTGPMTITQDNVVIENKIINGSLRVTGDNVIIRNCTIVYNGYWGIDAEGAKNITIQNCDITGPGYSGKANAAILGSGNFIGNDISKSENGIVLGSGASNVKGNYIHDLEAAGSDPHYDGIAVQGGQNHVLIQGNTILARDTSNIIIQDYFGAVNDVKIDHNYLGGSPGINIYVEGRFGNGTTNVSITNNYLEKGFYNYFSIVQSSPVISDNVQFLPGQTPPSAPSLPTDPTVPAGPTTPTEPTDPSGQTFWGTRANDWLPSTGQSNAGDDIFWGRSGDDVLCGGAGRDKIDGGSGIDVATYVGSKSGVTVDLNAGTASGGDAAGDTLTSIESLTGSSYGDRLVGSSAGNVLNGGGGSDVLSGLGGNDTLIGGEGSDRLYGGSGIDTLTGGTGNDYFGFNTALSAKSNFDKVVDFNAADDTILLDNAIFSKLADGVLAAANFRVGGTAGDRNDYVFYNKATGALYYDADGSGSGAAVHFATLMNKPTLTNADIVVV